MAACVSGCHVVPQLMPVIEELDQLSHAPALEDETLADH